MLSKTNVEAKKVLVLGSSSFAGGWFTKIALDAGYSVFAISRSENYGTIFCPFDPSSYGNSFNSTALDINRDRSKVIEIAQTWNPEIVVDFAGQGMVAPSWDSPQDWYETNVVAKAEIYNALFEKNSFKKLIKISTPEVYGSNDELITEHHPFSPSTPYSVSHAAIDLHLLALWRQARFPVVFGRFANFYGAHQQLYRIIPLTIVNALLGRNLHLHGGGTSVRSFIHAIDVGKAILKMMQHGRFGQNLPFWHG